ncbi:MAG: exodeoxyribonuclease VII large subunit [Endomicrobium sp.]|jgi:exodeoxyribonuclease VII large subunit|nr:exodeoxyribonuclease VII large subunit [Endomicrobium sp.]
MNDSEENNKDFFVYTVTQINDEIKYMLEEVYPGVWISGEISNFKLYSSGHMYFSIKDENSQINAVMFQSLNTGLNFFPQDGMQVLVYGHISAYPKRSNYQIIIGSMQQQGKGILSVEFERLKKKLQIEGLFDKSTKKPVAEIVSKIGVVTSQDGAALHDILKVLNNLKADVDVLIYPVRVQGKEAEIEIPEAIKYLNKNHKELDVLLVGRGGGSIEDLWAFNTESVARAIFESEIPIISCVGHEIDFTIADFTADLRSPTPSAAAEMVVRNAVRLKLHFEDLKETFFDIINIVFKNAKLKLEALSSARAFTKPYLIYEDKIAYVDFLSERIKQSFDRILRVKSDKISVVMHALDLVSPLAVLNRGYSICRDEKGAVVKDTSVVKKGENISLTLSKGKLKAVISGVNDNG